MLPPWVRLANRQDQHNPDNSQPSQSEDRSQIPDRPDTSVLEREDLAQSSTPPYVPDPNPRALSEDYNCRKACQTMPTLTSVLQTAHTTSGPSVNVPLSHRLANLAAPFTPPAPVVNPPVQACMEHEAKMINNLIWHIRNSLSEMSHDLPEIKGLRVNLPEAYAGEDDIERIDNWLQGLLCHFKLNRLTADDRDADRVLVLGTCLKGKAEQWFNHEVECPLRVTPDWTYETVIIGLFRLFITTATAQQAVHRYGQVKYT
jgi:hypothetical protein